MFFQCRHPGRPGLGLQHVRKTWIRPQDHGPESPLLQLGLIISVVSSIQQQHLQLAEVYRDVLRYTNLLGHMSESGLGTRGHDRPGRLSSDVKCLLYICKDWQ